MNRQRSVIFSCVIKMQRSVYELKALDQTGRSVSNCFLCLERNILIRIPFTVRFVRRRQVDCFFIIYQNSKDVRSSIVEINMLVKEHLGPLVEIDEDFKIEFFYEIKEVAEFILLEFETNMKIVKIRRLQEDQMGTNLIGEHTKASVADHILRGESNEAGRILKLFPSVYLGYGQTNRKVCLTSVYTFIGVLDSICVKIQIVEVEGAEEQNEQVPGLKDE